MRSFCGVDEYCGCRGRTQRGGELAGDVARFTDAGGQNFTRAVSHECHGLHEVFVDFDGCNGLGLRLQNRSHAFFYFHFFQDLVG